MSYQHRFSFLYRHGIMDYILLLATKLFMVAAGIRVLLSGHIDTAAMMIRFTVPIGNTITIITFLKLSFEGMQEIVATADAHLQQKQEVMMNQIMGQHSSGRLPHVYDDDTEL
jgi:hypothetical protein